MKLSAMDSADLLRDLGAILRDVALREILPRFRALAATEIQSKATTDDPDDLVTSADHAAEASLLSSLPALVSGSKVIGEEGSAADPSQLELLREDAPVWIVDPLDGTRNFASGRGPFGPMAALVHHGVVLAAGILLPLEDRLFLAARGQGAFDNGKRLRQRRRPGTRLVGTSNLRFAPGDHAASLVARIAEHDQVPPVMCAAHEYAEIAQSGKDYVVYFRLLPWDHAPGALIVREAGGVVRHPDGSEYDVFDGVKPTLVAPTEAIWHRACAELFGER
jgi:fructose-1,6-bisphosphatase/inositol monophosphatase family enzyme